MANWPTSLPKPLVSGYQGGAGAAFQRSDMAMAPARQRKVATNVPRPRQAVWKFDAAQMADFISFWENDINLGTDWFSISLNIGSGEVACEARFVQPYDDQGLSGSRWQVSGKLEVRIP